MGREVDGTLKILKENKFELLENNNLCDKEKIFIFYGTFGICFRNTLSNNYKVSMLEDTFELFKNSVKELSRNRIDQYFYNEFSNLQYKDYINLIKDFIKWGFSDSVDIVKLIEEKIIKYSSLKQWPHQSTIQRKARLATIIFNLFINDENIKCEFSNCTVNQTQIMIASHMLPQRFIKNYAKFQGLSIKQKLISLITPANVLLLCATHDKMIDNFLINFDKNNNHQITNCKYNSHNKCKNKICVNDWNKNYLLASTSFTSFYSRNLFFKCYDYIFTNNLEKIKKDYDKYQDLNDLIFNAL